MTKLIINTPAAADYQSVIRTFIRTGFTVDAFTLYNQTLIIEISNYQDMLVSKCNNHAIMQSIYDLATKLGIANITMQIGNVAFTINDKGCYAATEAAISLNCVYNAVGKVIANRATVGKVIANRADELAKCYAVVQAEQLAEDIAFNIHFNDCKKRIYQIDYNQYDAVTLCNKLAQIGIKSYAILHTHQLVIV